MTRPLRTTRRMRCGLQTWRCRHDRAGRSGSVRRSTDVDYPERLDRLSTLFRLIWIIPIAIVLSLLTASGNQTMVTASGQQVAGTGGGLLAGLAGATALMIIVRLRYPRWWFDFARELTRFGARVSAYLALLTDRYPSTVDEQSVHLEIEYPDVERDLNRWLPLVKWLLAIPHYFVLHSCGSAPSSRSSSPGSRSSSLGAIPRPLFDYVVGVSRWTDCGSPPTPSWLVTDRYPPFSLHDSDEQREKRAAPFDRAKGDPSCRKQQ